MRPSSSHALPVLLATAALFALGACRADETKTEPPAPTAATEDSATDTPEPLLKEDFEDGDTGAMPPGPDPSADPEGDPESETDDDG